MSRARDGPERIARSGDSGEASSYPAASPNVLSVGGRDLSLGSSGVYPGTSTSGEIAWAASSGGLTSEPNPA